MDDLESLAQAAQPAGYTGPGGPAGSRAISYRSASRPHVPAPNYTGIVLGSMVLYAVGALYVLFGIFAIVGAVIGGGRAASSARDSFDVGVAAAGSTFGIVIGAVAIGGGLLFI